MKLRPIFKQRIWGADHLRTLFQKDLPAETPIGESWELADLPEDTSTIAEGYQAGRTLRWVLDHFGSELGFSRGQRAFPFGLLIKFLDARDDLSVQVHPDADACNLFPGARLKTECWYVLHAEANARIYRGLRPGVGRQQLETALTDGNLADLIKVHPARRGDFHYLPAGTIHALGAGVIVAEIQTPSDTTYRLYDWDRLDASGKGRQLHIPEALASIHYTDTAPVDTGKTSDNPPADGPSRQFWKGLERRNFRIRTLLDMEYFSVAKLTTTTAETLDVSCDRPFVVISLSSEGCIGTDRQDRQTAAFRPGDTLLVPRMERGFWRITGPGECLLACLGPLVA
ncbi:MAG: class I mannose-6-phosphate isomerase [Sedimentisphaerales bacterium]|nr:class I mannose-6-phosphate isomerase [Sedimentisphaerales bacterium]